MKTKILISYHDEHKLIKSDILQPIQTGCANAPKLFDGMFRDNDGENISDRNNQYNELSAQYWAWKNYNKLGDPDYIGFMHYRRHFMFDGWEGNPQSLWLANSNVYCVPYVCPEYLKHINDKHIKKQLKNCDCIVIKPYDLINIKRESIREQYGRLTKQDITNFDIFIKTAKEIAPEYIPEIEQIEKGHIQYLCNMFVMSKDLFMEYSKFCFDVLFETEKRINVDTTDDAAARALGYFGEFLLSIFIFKLKKNKNIRIKELNASFILSDEQIENLYFQYWYNWFMSKIIWGKKKQKYKQKRKNIKKMICFYKNAS